MSIFKPCHVAVAALLVSAAPAFAQDQEGLVNVDVSGNTVQLPIAVAANICDVDVNVLAQQAEAGETACTIDQETVAENNNAGGASGGDQEGLVNVAIQDNTVQLPIAIAANLCDVDVNALAEQVEAGDTECEIVQGARAENNGGGNGNGGNGTNAGAATDTLENAADAAGDATDAAGDAANNAADAAGDMANDAADAAGDAAESTAETAEEVTE